ncbi:MAG TPA: hypothetical protein VFL55_12160 [Acetobacteraceae bacterium]|nr:hypothetical protein [Acetobacteraceae bacterium]
MPMPGPKARTVDAFVPTTFLERGVAVPFTTPPLSGARVRPGERKPLELIVNNPAGGRGVYIVAWDDVGEVYSLTLNDRRLTEAVGRLRGVTPDKIRHAAREVAGEGLAGRGVVAAARRAQTADELAQIQANFDLLLELVRQTEHKTEDATPPEKARPYELEQRGRRAVARIAPKLGRTPEAVAIALEELAAAFRSIGVRNSARVPEEIETIVRVRQELMAWSESKEALLAANAADMTVALAKSTLADAQALPRDMKALLRLWSATPGDVEQLLARPDWLLDGWDRICAVWDTAADRYEALVEMLALIPLIPSEADLWLSRRFGPLVDLPHYRSRVVRQLEDWRTGITVSDLVARNEVLLEKSL